MSDRAGGVRGWSRSFRRKLGIQLYAPKDIPGIKRVQEELIDAGARVDVLDAAIHEFYRRRAFRSEAARKGWRRRRIKP